MQFLNLQLNFTNSQLTLHVQTHQNTEQFELYGPVTDPQELAHQAEMFVGIHLRPYFDHLPVDSCRLSVAADVPELIRERCLSELLKLSKTNDFLTKTKALQNQAITLGTKPSSETSKSILAIYSADTPVEALLNMRAFSEEQAYVLGYLASQTPADEHEAQLRSFVQDSEAWFAWYVSLGVSQLYCGVDFVAEFERHGVVLSAVLGAIGQALVVVDHPYASGKPMVQYDKRMSNSSAIVRYVQDEKSLLWARWLGLINARLGSLKSVEYQYSVPALTSGFVSRDWQDVDITTNSVISEEPATPGQADGILLCEDLNIHRLINWLPQAYFIKGLLDQHVTGSASNIALTDIWLGVMKRLIVGSNESTDYDVVVLVRRLEFIADALHNLQLIEFVQDLAAKTQVRITGQAGWEKLFPELWVEGYGPEAWREAAAAFPQATLLHAQGIFHPCLSERCIDAVVTGRTSAYFSSFHQLCEQHCELDQSDPVLSWLAQHHVVSADACCVHALSAVSDRATMVDKRQATLTMLQEHNKRHFEQLTQRQWQAPATSLEQSVDQCLGHWNDATEQFYAAHTDMFHESLLALNPSVELGITDELKASAPAYLKQVLDTMEAMENSSARKAS